MALAIAIGVLAAAGKVPRAAAADVMFFGELGLDGPPTLRALRRTLVIELAYRPGGLLAAKIHLKHVSVVIHRGLRCPARRRPGLAARRSQ